MEQTGPISGDAVLLLHGFPYDVRESDPVRNHLTGRRVIVPYLRGFGPTRYRSRNNEIRATSGSGKGCRGFVRCSGHPALVGRTRLGRGWRSRSALADRASPEGRERAYHERERSLRIGCVNCSYRRPESRNRNLPKTWAPQEREYYVSFKDGPKAPEPEIAATFHIARSTSIAPSLKAACLTGNPRASAPSSSRT